MGELLTLWFESSDLTTIEGRHFVVSFFGKRMFAKTLMGIMMTTMRLFHSRDLASFVYT